MTVINGFFGARVPKILSTVQHFTNAFDIEDDTGELIATNVRFDIRLMDSLNFDGEPQTTLGVRLRYDQGQQPIGFSETAIQADGYCDTSCTLSLPYADYDVVILMQVRQRDGRDGIDVVMGGDDLRFLPDYVRAEKRSAKFLDLQEDSRQRA